MDHVFSIAPSFDGPPDPGLSPTNGRPEHFNSPFGWKSNVAAQRGRDYETSPKLLRAMFFHNSLIRKRRVASVPLKPHAHREASVKTAMTILLICTAALSGCATRPDQPGPTAQSAISRALDKRIIDCALPYLSAHNQGQADVQYDYHDGSVQFHTQDAGLTTHLQECAAPTSGPRGRFDGRMEIWPANAS
ncbi:hypothetical protein ACOTFF_13945 [Achromobacter xylosoxidans]